MAILLPASFLLITIAILAVLYWQKAHPFWSILAVCMALLLGLGVLWTIRSPQPWELNQQYAQPFTLAIKNFRMVGDFTSWTFVFTLNLGLLTSLLLSVNLTPVEVMRQQSHRLIQGVTIVLFSHLVVLSGNLLTFICSFALYDGFVLLNLIRGHDPVPRRVTVGAWGWRVASIWLMLWALLHASAVQAEHDWATLPSASMFALLAGISLRLIRMDGPDLPGVSMQDMPWSTWHQSIFTLGELAIIWSLAMRLTTHFEGYAYKNLWLMFFGLIACLASLQWAFASQKKFALGSFFLASCGVFLGAMLYTDPMPLLVAMGGTLMFMVTLVNYQARRRKLLPILLLYWLTIATLMLTLPWSSQNSNEPVGIIYKVLWVLSMSLFLVGHLRHSLSLLEEQSPLERWMWVTNILGLGIPALGILLPAYWRFSILAPIPRDFIHRFNGWPSIGAVVLMALLFWLKTKHLSQVTLPLEVYANKARRTIQIITQVISRFTGSLATLFEGRGGVLWTLLVIALLIAMNV